MSNDLIKSGVYIKFPSRIKYIKYLSQFNVDITTNQQSLNKYINEGKYLYTVEMPEFNLIENFYFDTTNVETCLFGLSKSKQQMNLLSILNNLIYNENYSKSLYYKAFATLLELENTKQKIQKSKEGKFPKTSIVLFLAELGNTIGDTLSQGWFDLALDIAKQINFLIDTDIDIFNDANDNYGRRRTQYFILRLINNWQGWSDSNYPNCAYDEPLFNALIEEWRTDDMARIEHLLLCALDRHTHQCRPDNSKAFFDFSSGFYEYIPYEVLSVLRLREHLGLQNPVLEHVLTNTPLGQLHPITNPNDYMDDFLLGILKRVREEYPDFADDLFAKGSLYADTVQQTTSKRSWKFWKK
ncbi:hypothetical protein NDN13_01620 [Acinetobacter sp. C32I]|uniref:hypothetical protein n=1 Tax=Acinetobacter sp. C32I TaxID=2950074 RepID=UPI002037443D|nr:hypothetical protein [Acinetobacter sp. C32I]USA53918.1 hypothetical protein NDN13_01620 [Acinetobacter sp. C32I]